MSGNRTARKNYPVLCTLLAMIGFVQISSRGWAKDETNKNAEASISDAVVQDDAKPEQDPFAVPEGDAEVLVRHIGTLAGYRPRGKTVQERAEDNQKRLMAVVATCDRLLSLKPEEKIEIFALENQYGALGALGAAASDAMKQKLAELEEQMSRDSRPEIAKLPVLGRIRQQSPLIRRQSAIEQEALVEQILSYIERFGVDQQIASISSSVGRSLGYTDQTDLAVKMYDIVGKALAESDDPLLTGRAEKMFGAARMLKLPGNVMVVKGTTGDGREFDWSAYRGRFVLVDFWASWCGPCIAELPNMKANLARYGDQGFAIVGVNLDSSRDAYEKCIREKEITWENIVGDEAAGWNNPLATYYGISAIPTAILVDPEGKVISLRARGATLDQLLAEHLGSLEKSPESDQNAKPTKDE